MCHTNSSIPAPEFLIPPALFLVGLFLNPFSSAVYRNVNPIIIPSVSSSQWERGPKVYTAFSFVVLRFVYCLLWAVLRAYQVHYNGGP